MHMPRAAHAHAHATRWRCTRAAYTCSGGQIKAQLVALVKLVVGDREAGVVFRHLGARAQHVIVDLPATVVNGEKRVQRYGCSGQRVGGGGRHWLKCRVQVRCLLLDQLQQH